MSDLAWRPADRRMGGQQSHARRPRSVRFAHANRTFPLMLMPPLRTTGSRPGADLGVGIRERSFNATAKAPDRGQTRGSGQSLSISGGGFGMSSQKKATDQDRGTKDAEGW